MLEHKVKNVLLVEDLHLFGILNYHNKKNVALMLFFMRLSFFSFRLIPKSL